MTEFVEGLLVHKCLKYAGYYQQQIAQYVQSVCDALAHVHKHGVAHKTVRARNVVITPNRRSP